MMARQRGGFARSAEQGDARAQSNLGCMYEPGVGVSQDHAEAGQWYRKAPQTRAMQ